MPANAIADRMGGIALLMRYSLASAAALVLDYATFLVLLRCSVPAVPASMLGYASGIVAHWLASSRLVFSFGVAPAGPARRRQQALFVVTALAGLAVTAAVVAAGKLAGLDPRLAKLAAVAFSFLATWHLRHRHVFVLIAGHR
jgi:putative flippase GtrA